MAKRPLVRQAQRRSEACAGWIARESAENPAGQGKRVKPHPPGEAGQGAPNQFGNAFLQQQGHAYIKGKQRG